MSVRTVAFATALLVSRVMYAQSAHEHVVLGDHDYAARNAAGALHHYQEAIGVDRRSYEALWKASRSAVDLGEAERNGDRRTQLYKSAKEYAQTAVQVNGNDPEGHFHLARSLGRAALTLGARERVKYANDVYEQAQAALRLNPNHPGGLHVMGVWNAEVMRLNGFTRVIARNVLGGRVFGEANWGNAVRYMERAVAVEPNRIVHRLDMAKIYADVGQKDKAREQYQQILRMPVVEFNDAAYQQEAREKMAAL